jgi:tetratricopeptide (TPR) repeat protein
MVDATNGLSAAEYLDRLEVMSYINDALHKVQKEQDSPYLPYGNVISVSPNPGRARPRRRVWMAGFFLFFLTVSVLAVWSYVRVFPKAPVRMAAVSGAGATVAEAQEQVQAVSIQKHEAGEKPRAVHPDVIGQKKNYALSATHVPDAETVFMQAVQKQRQGRLKEAKELYKQVIRARPRHYQALNNLGVVYMNMKVYQWAIVRFQEAIHVKQDYADAHYNLACLYAQKHDPRQSLLSLKNAVNYNPEVRQWALRDPDLKTLADLPEFKNILQARNE